MNTRNIVLIIIAILLVAFFLNKPNAAIGSVEQGNDYNATTTRNFTGTALTNLTVLKAGSGTLARVTVTGANTGIVRFWNATTTDVNRRTGNTASSSLLMIEIPASAAANDYDFDAEFSTGIIYEVVSGLAPTSTISWR